MIFCLQFDDFCLQFDYFCLQFDDFCLQFDDFFYCKLLVYILLANLESSNFLLILQHTVHKSIETDFHTFDIAMNYTCASNNLNVNLSRVTIKFLISPAAVMLKKFYIDCHCLQMNRIFYRGTVHIKFDGIC